MGTREVKVQSAAKKQFLVLGSGEFKHQFANVAHIDIALRSELQLLDFFKNNI